ncbi:peptidoglycan-binding protein [Marinobacter sp. BW6]|uniref:peptidoglycan-binding domain-containing protein n=1 Tax=Marinobacter sp. BW6 TaxID=2592624 RepID=UPI0011DED34C|nr:peptidoglycan-binding domain-containing protein [Marinobacter sp. BW6]TYC63901.1 peptidoglycan-binding protein [Marinobacter sp. BW6]
MLAAATCLGSAHASQPEKVIFAAENALYGAGHDIGRADGWLDNQLRAAIRAYQSENGLQTNGNLDADTLNALGINVPSGATITANSVGSRTDSMEGLGLSIPKPKPVTPKVATAEPEPVQEPTQQADQKSSGKVQSTAKPKTEKSVVQIVTDETSKPVEDESPKKPEVVISDTAEPAVAESPQPNLEPSPEPSPEPEPEIVDKAPTATRADKDPVLARIPTEPTSAGQAEPETTKTEPSTTEQIDTPARENQTVADRPRSSGGGFFSALFDFFFGWLV